MVSSNNSVILGVNNLNVPRIVAIIAEVCAEDALQDDEQVYMRLLSIARHVQVGVAWHQCLLHYSIGVEASFL